MQNIVSVRIQDTTMSARDFTDKEYDYFSLGDVEYGDLVVVNTKGGLRIGVVSRKLTSSEYACQYIVQKIDLEEYKKRRETYEKQQSIKAYLDLEIEKQQEIKRYKSLLNNDDSLVQSLAEDYINNLREM